MELTKDKFLYLWRMRETIFHDKRNRKILDRFKWLEDLFKEMEATTVVYQPSGDETQVFVNNTLVNNRDGQNPDNGYFACEADGMAAQGALKGVENMAWSYPGFMEIINKGSSEIWSDNMSKKKKTTEHFVYLNNDKQMYRYEQQFSISRLGSLRPRMQSGGVQR